MRKFLTGLAVAASLAGAAAEAPATTVAYTSYVYTFPGEWFDAMDAAIVGQGMTPLYVPANDFSAFDLSQADIVIFEHYSYAAVLSADLVESLRDWVAAGGALIVSDWNTEAFVTSSTLLFGQPGAQKGACCSENLGVFANTPISQGPAGTLDNLSLDNLAVSSHGGILASSLTGTIEAFLYEEPDPNMLVAFAYAYGDGHIFFSTSPWFDRFRTTPHLESHLTYRDVYAPNVLAYMADQLDDGDVVAVAEPASLALLGSGLAAIGGMIRLRRRESRRPAG
jgi:hypothetical protein